MTQANDIAILNDYLDFIVVGATEAEALMQVATANDMTCGDVCEALMRTGLHNPCGLCETYGE